MLHIFRLHDFMLRTADVICTMNGKLDILPGEFWRLVGCLVPGDVDHVALYIGPNGRCVEAGSRGVISFEIPDHKWDSEHMTSQRGLLFDSLYGMAFPLEARNLAIDEEGRMRSRVADYALQQVGKPYNLNFLDPEREDAFYCSQLVYKAYQQVGLNLNTGLGMERLPGTNAIIYPQEIWSSNVHQKAAQIHRT